MHFTIIELILLIIFSISFLTQLVFSFVVHARLVRIQPESIPDQPCGRLSVIICARNEVENLERFLPAILNQDYPDFEVVVVNDRSWDGTRTILESFAKNNAHLKLVNIADGEKFIAGKKFAVSMGIKAASHDWLVFTDADCEPASNQWLKGMQPPADAGTEIMLGYSPYFKKASFLNLLIRFETFFTAVNYLSFALKGMPYMGVGRNMAYQKALFFKNKGFAAHMHIPSGDDDLFVNANANPGNTRIMTNKATHVWSEPQKSWGSYLRQKKRHFGAGKLYKPGHKFILSLQVVSQFIFYASFTALCFFQSTLYQAVAVMILSIFIRSFIYPKLLARLNYKELRWWFPLLDSILFLFLVVNAFLSIFMKKVRWK